MIFIDEELLDNMDRFSTYNDFDKSVIYEKMARLSSELKEEQEKDASERDADRERELMFAQLMQGMKLNTIYGHRNMYF